MKFAKLVELIPFGQAVVINKGYDPASREYVMLFFHEFQTGLQVEARIAFLTAEELKVDFDGFDTYKAAQFIEEIQKHNPSLS